MQFVALTPRITPFVVAGFFGWFVPYPAHSSAEVAYALSEEVCNSVGKYIENFNCDALCGRNFSGFTYTEPGCGGCVVVGTISWQCFFPTGAGSVEIDVELQCDQSSQPVTIPCGSSGVWVTTWIECESCQ